MKILYIVIVLAILLGILYFAYIKLVAKAPDNKIQVNETTTKPLSGDGRPKHFTIAGSDIVMSKAQLGNIIKI